MAKMGRPIIGLKKDIDLKVRVDDVTHEELLKYCDEHHITKAEAVRLAIQNFLKNKKGSSTAK